MAFAAESAGRKNWKPSRLSRCAANAVNQVRPASSLECPTAAQRCANPNQKKPEASNAAIMAHQVQPTINTYPIDRVSYAPTPEARQPG